MGGKATPVAGTPRPALAIGLLLVAPLPAAALAMALGSVTVKLTAYVYLVNYGALLLAFAGATHWGLAVARGERDWRWYGLAAFALLLAWLALGLVQPGPRLMVLALGFVVVFIADSRAAAGGLAPGWHRDLRKPLTVLALLALAIALAAVRYAK